MAVKFNRNILSFKMSSALSGSNSLKIDMNTQFVMFKFRVLSDFLKSELTCLNWKTSFLFLKIKVYLV